jgi:hypothetical protein
MSTAERRLVPGEPEAGGYRRLVPADGEQHVVRDELASGSLPAGWARAARPLLVIAHLSDTHVMDHQSPGRVELLDRFSDPDSPLRPQIGIIGTYRAQELFTYQVAEAMSRAVRQHPAGPLSGAPVDLAVVTGDATDNCQRNELRATDGALAIACTVIDSAAPVSYAGDLAPGRPPRGVSGGSGAGGSGRAGGGRAGSRPARSRRPGSGLSEDGSPARLAALSRELAANDWQVRDLITPEGGAGAGTAADRNVILTIDWPRPAAG